MCPEAIIQCVRSNSRQTMKKYYVFVVVTFIICSIHTCMVQAAKMSYQKLLLAHNPRCGYGMDRLLRMNTTTPFSFDPSEEWFNWKEFFNQNHSYVNPAYLPNEWALNPPVKVMLKIYAYDSNLLGLDVAMVYIFDSTGKNSTNWLDGNRITRSSGGRVALNISFQNDLMTISPVGSDKYWLIADIRGEQDNQLIWLTAKTTAQASQIHAAPESLDDVWDESDYNEIFDTYTISNSSDDVIYPTQCLAGIELLYKSIPSTLSSNTSLTINFKTRGRLWVSRFNLTQTTDEILFDSSFCVENITVLASLAPMSEITINLLATAGEYNRAHSVRVYAVYEVAMGIQSLTVPTPTTMKSPKSTQPHTEQQTTAQMTSPSPEKSTTTIANPRTTTEKVSMTTPPITTSKPLICLTSNWHTQVNNTVMASLSREIAELKKQLAVNKSQLTSSIRKKISVPDKRVSSQVLGYAAGLIMGFLSVFLVVSDIPVFVKAFKIMKNNIFGN